MFFLNLNNSKKFIIVTEYIYLYNNNNDKYYNNNIYPINSFFSEYENIFREESYGMIIGKSTDKRIIKIGFEKNNEVIEIKI